MNVQELINQGAKVNISFHENNSREEAYEAIKPFAHLGEIESKEGIDIANLRWFIITSKNIEITSFYYVEEKQHATA